MMISDLPVQTQVYLNGEYMPLSEAKVSVLDRGFIFGDGVYEVVPVYDAHPFCMEQHLNRLDRNLKALRINVPFDRAAWKHLILQLVARAASPTCFVYLQVTRGVAPRNHAFPNPAVTPTVFGMTTAFEPPGKKLREQGLRTIGIVDERWLHCEIKSISLLGNVLAKQQAIDAEVDEAIQFRDGLLTEGTASNIWVIQQGKLLVPPHNHLILEGIRYQLLIELAAECDIAFEARAISKEEVIQANELLLTSATREVLPVVQFDGQPVGTGQPGPIYKQLRAAYDARLAALSKKTSEASLIEYPSVFPIKVMGKQHPDFAQLMTEIVLKFDPTFDPNTIEMRPSKEGRYLGLTFAVTVTSRIQLDALYGAFHEHPLVSIVL